MLLFGFEEKHKFICRSILLKYTCFFIVITERLDRCLIYSRAYVLTCLRACVLSVLTCSVCLENFGLVIKK